MIIFNSQLSGYHNWTHVIILEVLWNFPSSQLIIRKAPRVETLRAGSKHNTFEWLEEKLAQPCARMGGNCKLKFNHFGWVNQQRCTNIQVFFGASQEYSKPSTVMQARSKKCSPYHARWSFSHSHSNLLIAVRILLRELTKKCICWPLSHNLSIFTWLSENNMSFFC